ncbi:hypothetical protein ACIA6T_28055 [Streptomyces sp. NPDC051740]|uniref:hypothetical protein n=1 Tax=Streptomyces sp. NPDC051740 TaxID=3365673 RepID=UPI0037A3060D
MPAGAAGRPLLVRGLTDVVQVACGPDVACAPDRDGTVRARRAGRERRPRRRDRSDHTSARPVWVNGLPGIRRIAAHGLTGYAIDPSGGPRARGSGPALGDHAPRTVRPVRVPLSGPALDVSGHHAVVGEVNG